MELEAITSHRMKEAVGAMEGPANPGDRRPPPGLVANRLTPAGAANTGAGVIR